MITRKNRFHGYNSLRYTYQNGKTIHGSYCALKYARNSRRMTYRVAIVVSKRVSKSAVVRNRIRRRIYESVRRNVSDNQPYDLIFTVFSDRLSTVPIEELNEDVVDKLKNAGIDLKPQMVSALHDIVDHKEA